METNEKPKTKAAHYREHVLKAKTFPDSAQEYCRQNGLEAPLFYRIKSEMGLSRIRRRSFIKVKSVPADLSNNLEPRTINPELLPNPKWLAELLSHFLAMR